MSRELIENLRDYADIAEAGEKSHWADAMRQAAEYIRTDLDKTLPEPVGVVRAITPIARTAEFNFNTDLNGNIPKWLKEGAKVYVDPPARKPLSDDEIIDMYFDGFSIGELLGFARAIEEAHGIGGDSGNT